MSHRGSNKKVAHSLVAVSSAAVMAVYAAGYARTKSAADQMESRSTDRRPGTPGPGRGPSAVSAPPASPGQSTPVLAPATESAATPLVIASVTPAPTGIAATPSPSEALAPAPAAGYVAPPAESLQPPVEHKVEAPAPPPPPPPPPAPKWKDGTYTGWGTSRHGDIQAQVTIEDGRIKAATIAQCLTRYSCDVIDKIIPQVAQRQSPETDFVSGATQSTNAFYYGVVEALALAKAK